MHAEDFPEIPIHGTFSLTSFALHKSIPKVSYQISWKGQNIVNRIRFWSVMPVFEFRTTFAVMQAWNCIRQGATRAHFLALHVRKFKNLYTQTQHRTSKHRILLVSSTFWGIVGESSKSDTFQFVRFLSTFGGPYIDTPIICTHVISCNSR